MKAWQRGYDLAVLGSLAARFQHHDGDRTRGAFSKVKENTVAAWLDAGRLTDSGTVLLAAREAQTRTSVKDFTGRVAVVLPPGAVVIQRAAGPASALAAEIDRCAAGAPILWKAWAHHPDEQAAAERLGLRRAGTAISASSEVRTIWVRSPAQIATPLPAAEEAGIVPLPDLATGDAEALSGWPALVADLWIDHYSSYNARRSWHAVGLRSYGGDPAFIEKPSEMSKAWKAEHPDMLHLPVLDTPLMDALPGARALLAALPCRLQRVRLMRLTVGGELKRHADITDRDAGVQSGRIARLHLPVETNPACDFTSWTLADTPTQAHMAAGCWWYLDVRKPHRAVNGGTGDRVHLVADAVVTRELREVLDAAAAQNDGSDQ